jgi:hypothetical protein
MATLADVLEQAWLKPFKTKSDFARDHADIVAMAASDGLLTTKVATGLYQRQWILTPRGLSHLHALTGMHDEG